MIRNLTVFDGAQVESNLVYYQLMVAVKNIQGKADKGKLVYTLSSQ